MRRSGTVALLLALALSATPWALAQAPEKPATEQIGNERLAAEEAWAAAEHARKLRVKDGSTEPPIPPPSGVAPTPWSSLLTVALGLCGGLLWGRWHRRRAQRKDKARRERWARQARED